MIINCKGPLLKQSTNLAPPRIGTKQNETKRRRSIVNCLISDISDFGLLNADGYANVRAQYQLNNS